jgi:hypothetical protein
MLHFPWQGSNFNLINFNHIVKDANMRDILGYWIPENRFPFDKKGKSKMKKKSGVETAAPKQDAPKKGKEKKQGALDKGKKKVQGFPDKGKGKMPRDSVRVPTKDQKKTLQPVSKLMGDTLRAGGGDFRRNGQRVKTMAKKRPHTPEAGGGDEAAKRPKHANVNQHLRDLVAESQACYDHLRICILTISVSSEEDLSDWEEVSPVDFEFMHVSNGSEFEDLEGKGNSFSFSFICWKFFLYSVVSGRGDFC